MNLLGRTAALVVSALLLAGCGDQTSSRSAADDPTTTPSPTVPSRADAVGFAVGSSREHLEPGGSPPVRSS